MKQHAFIVMIMILLRDLLLSVTEPLSQLLVHNLLNLQIQQVQSYLNWNLNRI